MSGPRRPADSYELDTPSPSVTRILFSHPGSRNALSLELVERLGEIISSQTEGVVVLGSTHGAAFSSGADATIPDAQRAVVSRALYDLYETMLLCPCPILAVIEGPAVGGGAQIALASDLRIAGPGARFLFPGVHHGIPIGMWALPDLVGRGRALDLCLTARWVDAPEALSIGLVDRLSDQPMSSALAMAEGLVALPPSAAATIKASSLASGVLDRLRAEAAQCAPWSGALGRPS